MDEEQRKWQKQYTSHIGAREFLILGGVVMGWILVGLLISVVTETLTVFLVFFLSVFVFAILSTRWKPAYVILYKILGNKNLPKEPFPRGITMLPKEPRAWWSYLPNLWWLILDMILLVLVIIFFTK